MPRLCRTTSESPCGPDPAPAVRIPYLLWEWSPGEPVQTLDCELHRGDHAAILQMLLEHLHMDGLADVKDAQQEEFCGIQNTFLHFELPGGCIGAETDLAARLVARYPFLLIRLEIGRK